MYNEMHGESCRQLAKKSIQGNTYKATQLIYEKKRPISANLSALIDHGSLWFRGDRNTVFTLSIWTDRLEQTV